jgi:hypothetical protein
MSTTVYCQVSLSRVNDTVDSCAFGDMKTASISVNKPPFKKIFSGMYQRPRVDVSWKKSLQSENLSRLSLQE